MPPGAGACARPTSPCNSPPSASSHRPESSLSFPPSNGEEAFPVFPPPPPQAFLGVHSRHQGEGSCCCRRPEHPSSRALSRENFTGTKGFHGSLFLSNPEFTSNWELPKRHPIPVPEASSLLRHTRLAATRLTEGESSQDEFSTTGAAGAAECHPVHGWCIAAVLGHGHLLASIRGGWGLFKGRRADGLGEPQGKCPHTRLGCSTAQAFQAGTGCLSAWSNSSSFPLAHLCLPDQPFLASLAPQC
jgi:hypothetical protein